MYFLLIKIWKIIIIINYYLRGYVENTYEYPNFRVSLFVELMLF